MNPLLKKIKLCRGLSLIHIFGVKIFPRDVDQIGGGVLYKHTLAEGEKRLVKDTRPKNCGSLSAAGVDGTGGLHHGDRHLVAGLGQSGIARIGIIGPEDERMKP